MALDELTHPGGEQRRAKAKEFIIIKYVYAEETTTRITSSCALLRAAAEV